MCDEEVLDAVRERHADLGSTFAREKLVEVHGHLKKGDILELEKRGHFCFALTFPNLWPTESCAKLLDCAAQMIPT